MDLLYGDLETDQPQEEETAVSQTRSEFDPLQGETFSLASVISRRRDGLPAKKIAISEFTASGGVSESYVPRTTAVFFGPPPSASLAPHFPDSVVLVSRLGRGVSDAEIRKAASEIFGPVRIVRVLIDDPTAGNSAGLALVEFSDVAAAAKAAAASLLGGHVRKISKAEFDRLAAGPFPVLDYGPVTAEIAAMFKR